MALFRSKFAAASALVAALSLSAPAQAIPLAGPRTITPGTVHDADAGNAANHRWDGYRYRRGPRTGDVIAGILVLGTIAAIAGQAQKNRQERVEPYPQRYPYPDENPRYRRGDRDGVGSQGLGRAVDICLGEVEQMRERVEGVDSASRRGDGWQVSGTMQGGEQFTCRIDNDGRVSDVRIGDGRADYNAGREAENGQWNDEEYARARARNGEPGDRLPPYPGGLLKSEEASGESTDALPGAPEYEQS